jgi:RNA polymerase sigma-70 factor (ECF subfamily)
MILSNVQALAPRPAAASARDDIDRELIAKIGNLDKDAFRSLCIHYHRILARFLSKFTRDRADIEEIVNDTLWIVWKNAGAFRSESRVSTWIMGIAYRCSMKALRRAKRHRRISRQQIADVEPTAGDASHMTENQQILKLALQKLPLEQRLVIELTYSLDRSCAETAEIVGCPVNTVKSRMFHARRKLRLTLAEDDCARGTAVSGLA